MRLYKVFHLLLLLNFPTFIAVNILLNCTRSEDGNERLGNVEETSSTQGKTFADVWPTLENGTTEINESVTLSRQFGIGDIIALINAINSIIMAIGDFLGAIGNIPALLFMLLPLLLLALLAIYFVVRDFVSKFFNMGKTDVVRPSICSCHKNNYYGWKHGKGWTSGGLGLKDKLLAWIKDRSDDEDDDFYDRRLKQHGPSTIRRAMDAHVRNIPLLRTAPRPVTIFKEQLESFVGKLVLSMMDIELLS